MLPESPDKSPHARGKVLPSAGLQTVHLPQGATGAIYFADSNYSGFWQNMTQINIQAAKRLCGSLYLKHLQTSVLL